MHWTPARRRAKWTAAFFGISACFPWVAAAGSLSARYNHASALLPNGNIIVAGGQTADGAVNATNSVQITVGRSAPNFTNASAMSVARASFTLTILPTGEALAAGGINGSGAVSSAEIYNPILNCWRPAGNMSSARFNHTATLLKNGNVLICGGDNGSGTLSSCDLYTPPNPPIAACSGNAGSFSPGPAMSVPRELHTATLLINGKVYIAGGFATSGSVGNYLVTAEVYTPGSPGFFSAASNLIEQRAGHAAVMLGNGKVLLFGGHNTKDDIANRGHLSSAELYDPISNSQSPASPMLVRDEHFSAALKPDGDVETGGGLGNITTSYFNASGPFVSGSSLALTAVSIGNSIMTLANGQASNVQINASFNLSVPVSGSIQNGVVLYSSPTFTFPGGSGYFTPGQYAFGSSPTGLWSDLQGTNASCPTGESSCGTITRSNTNTPPLSFAASGMVGAVVTISSASLTLPNGAIVAGSTVGFTGAARNNQVPPASITSGSMSFTTVGAINGFNGSFVGATINNIVLQVTAGSISDFNGLYSVSLTGASGVIEGCPGPNCPTLASDGKGGAQIPGPVTILLSNIQGSISITTSTLVGPTIDLSNRTLTGAAATAGFNPSRVDLSQGSFNVDVATVIIDNMIFGDKELYNPQSNSWSFFTRTAGITLGAYNSSGILTPGGEFVQLGGEGCNVAFFNASCPLPLVAYGGAGITYLVPGGWNTVSGAPTVSNHTATNLPNGQILIAGGSNGPNVVSASWLFNPTSQTFLQTGSLLQPRDLHTATLLPNGRVLVSGGYTTNAVSTGATTDAEIYYPDTGVWIPTTPLNQARDSHAALLMADGNVMVIGGYNNQASAYLNSVEVYYSTAGLWRTIAPMNVARAMHTATLLQDGRILVTGGVNQTGVQANAEIYDPNTGTWGNITCLDGNQGNLGPTGGVYCNLPSRIRVYGHAATLLQTGQVLISGGDDGFGETDTSLLYDPASNTWSDTRTTVNGLVYKRFNHTATLLPNGNVLVAGGARSLGNAVAFAELYSVSGASWTTIASLNSARAYHTATVAANGFVYLIGGSNAGQPVSGAEDTYFTGAIPDQYSVGAPPSARQPSISSVDATLFGRSQNVTMLGQHFLDNTEASCGGTAGSNSAAYQPRVVLSAIDGSGGTGSQGSGAFTLDLSTQIYALNAPSGNINSWTNVDSSITVAMPSLGPGVSPPPQGGQVLPYGWYHLRVGSNAQFSTSMLVQAGPSKPPVAPTNVVGVALSTTQIQWTWTWPVTAGMTPDGFNLYYSSNGVFITTIAYVTPGNTQTWIQAGLAPDTTGQISIAAYTLSGDGPKVVSPIVYSNVAAPTNLAVSSVTPNSIGLTWSTSGNATGTIYEISMSTLSPPNAFAGGDTSVSTPVPTLLGLTTNNYIITNLQPSTTYSFRVRGFDGFGNASAFANVVATQTLAPIGNVIGLRQGPTSIQWSWINPCIGQSPCSFNVYNGTSGVLIANVASSLFLETKLATNTANAVQVQAVTGAGAGPLSPPVAVYTDALVPASIPSPITGLSTGSFTVGWTASGNPLATRYEIIVTALGPGGGAISTFTTTGFAQSVNSLAPPASTYDAQVVAINGDGFATTVDSPTAVLDYGPVNLLANAPNGLSAPSVTPTSILLNWSTNNNSSSATYQVNYSTDNFVDVQTPLPFSAHASTGGFLITGLLSSSTYSFVVQAQNLVGVKTASSTVLTVQTSNGGAPPGQLGGTALANYDTTIAGTLGNGQQVSMFVPASSFPSNTQVVISSYSVGASPACPNVPAGAGMGIAITDSPAFQPQKPITVTLSYAPSQLGVPAAQAALMRLDPSGVCVPLQTVLDTAHLTLTAQLNHFSIYELGGLVPSSNVDSALIFPNPFYPGRGNGYVTFDHLPAGAWVRVFTLRGELVYATNTNGSGLITWPGTNQAGRPLASGVYLVSIELGSDKRVYKLAVER